MSTAGTEAKSIMQDRDELAKYMCDKIEATLKRYGRTVKRVGDHALVVCIKPRESLTEWRIVVRRTGHIEFEPLNGYAEDRPIPNLAEHIADALADEYDFTSGKDGSGGTVVMAPRALPKAPHALPVSTQ
jgi:hypothetical protein